jgi:hypothetical protein
MAMSKGMKWGLGIVAVLAVAAAVLYPRLVVSLPPDGANATLNTFKGTYGADTPRCSRSAAMRSPRIWRRMSTTPGG